MQPSYIEFKKVLREENSKLTCRQIEDMYNTIYNTQGYCDIDDTIADTPLPTSKPKGWWVQQIKQKEEGINPMLTYDECTSAGVPVQMGFKAKAAVANAQIINATPVEATQRDYAVERVKAIGGDHAQALRTQFHMDTIYPQTFLQLEALIKAGDYTVSDKAREDDACLYNTLYGVHFGKPADKAGYEAAMAVLKTATRKALNGATLKPLDQLEAVIDDFEAWTLPQS